MRLAFRPKDHPDVTILLADASSSGVAESRADPRRRIDEFWSQYGKVKSVWSSPYREIEFAGRGGLASFVTIERSDGAQDYGFVAIAADAADRGGPDLMLYVIRDAKRAKAKGIEPLDRDGLLKMAHAIAASVRRRATAP